MALALALALGGSQFPPENPPIPHPYLVPSGPERLSVSIIVIFTRFDLSIVTSSLNQEVIFYLSYKLNS